MSIFKDILEKKPSADQQSKTKREITIPEGISFLDANKSKIIVSVVNQNLVITKMIRDSNSYITEDIVLKKDCIPFLGEVLLEFFDKGNIDKLKAKLKVDEENGAE